MSHSLVGFTSRLYFLGPSRVGMVLVRRQISRNIDSMIIADLATVTQFFAVAELGHTS